MGRKKSKFVGFTLIELLVVISIIGLLSSIVLANLNSARQKAKIASAKVEVGVLYQSILRYMIDHNGANPALTLPAGSSQTDGNFYTLADWNSSWKTGYIDATIVNDPWGNTYVYDGNRADNSECGIGQTAVCSAGPNGVFESWNRTDTTPQGDDICMYFEPTCP